MRIGISHLLDSLPAGRARIALAGCLAAAAIAIPATAMAANGGDPDVGSPPCDAHPANLKVQNATPMIDPSNGAVMGWAYLVYSPDCQTEWVRVHYRSGYSPSPSIWLQNQNGTNLYTAESGVYVGTTDGPWAAWTFQLTNMRYQTACGGVQMYRSNGQYVNWNYVGCY
jgi:hypothetical protein